ncbi:hypothetical protein FLACHUCJ7_04351 [Flavobacterium chungangense]|uniref:Uncharacterized protein n=1 Tax=Flavobacterium chungangense TaxID=554283 RepID=A0A6V6ZFK6_9FLAO|nr:hypothetical protein FLACHUCJ7_04351 [Flavobacterium chungangense]
MVLKKTKKIIFFLQSLISLVVERIKKIENKAKNKLSLS